MGRGFGEGGRPPRVALAAWAAMALLAILYASRYGFNPTALIRFGSADMALHGAADTFPKELPPGTVILSNRGYDGQLYYWVARHLPYSEAGMAHIDTIFRYQRVGFPLAAWLLGAGHPKGIMAAMIGLTLLAPGAIAWAVASRLKASGVDPWWALAAGINTGTVLCVYNCVTDSLAVMCFALGWLAWEKGTVRGAWAAAAWWSYSVLTREQMLGAVGLAALWECGRLRWGRAALLSLAALPFLAWEAYLTARAGYVPLFLAKGMLGLPGASVVEYLRRLPPPALDKPTLMAWSSLPPILLAAACLPLGLRAAWKEREAAGLQLAFAALLLLSVHPIVFKDSITSTGRVGIVLFLFLPMLLRPGSGRLLKGTILASLLMAAAVAAGLYFFPVPPYVVT